MQYGYFDDINKEYVITTPQTPLPWINYLGSDKFFTLLSNTAGGYAFQTDAKLRRLTRYRYNNLPLDSDGFHMYIKEGDTIWNPGWQPTQTELDFYECRHGLGYSVIKGSKNGLSAIQELMVPKNDDILLMRVTLTNTTIEAKKLDLFSFIEFCLWDAQDDTTNFQRNFSTGEVEVEGTAIYHNKFIMDKDFNIGRSYLLDLGKVKNIARVIVNGQEVGVLWEKPFQADVSKFLRQGEV